MKILVGTLSNEAKSGILCNFRSFEVGRTYCVFSEIFPRDVYDYMPTNQ